MGKSLRSPKQYMVIPTVNAWVSLWEGMADRRMNDVGSQPTCYPRTSRRLEQRPHRRTETPIYTQTCLGYSRTLGLAENHRDLALFNMAIDCKLWGCGLVRLKVVDIMTSGRIKERASVRKSKTQKPVTFEITEGRRVSVKRWMKDPIMVGSEYLWPGHFHEPLHISTRQYAQIVREWVTSISQEATTYGTDTMRRTKVTQIYKKTGNLRAI